MKNLLKKLHIMSNHSEDSEGSAASSRGNKSISKSSPETEWLLHSRSHQGSEHKPFSGISRRLNSVANKHGPSPPSSSNVNRAARVEQPPDAAVSGSISDTGRRDSGSSTSRDADIAEEYQIQLALELSAREDPKAVQIEAVKQISLGSCAPDNTPAEVIAYRYWVRFFSCTTLNEFRLTYCSLPANTFKLDQTVFNIPSLNLNLEFVWLVNFLLIICRKLYTEKRISVVVRP
ncbi:hypothetical protein ACFX15_043678 [Malus domestica]